MRNDLYPIVFEPFCRYRDWGSDLLLKYFKLPSDSQPPAELFMLIDGQQGSSEIRNGALAGKTLSDFAKMGSDFMGRRRPGREGFPICVKYFANGKPLGLEVHPCDEAVRKQKQLRTNAKAWHVIHAEPDAKAHAELKPEFTQQQLLSCVGSPDLYELIYNFGMNVGDSCYLPSGRVHGIDPGFVILSIEQNDPTTFTMTPNAISEYHGAAVLDQVEEARNLVNFKDRTVPRIVADETKEESRNRKIPLVTTNPAFTLEELRLVSKMHQRANGDSFHIIIPVDGPLVVSCTGMSVELKKFEACLIPAKLGFYSTIPKAPTRVIRVS